MKYSRSNLDDAAAVDLNGKWTLQQEGSRKTIPATVPGCVHSDLVSAVEDWVSGKVQIHVTSDLLDPVRCRLRWKLTDVDGRVLRRGLQDILAKSGGNTPAGELCFQRELDRTGARSLLLWLELSAEKQPASRNLVLFARPKHLELPDPRISCEVETAEDGGFLVTIQSRKPALWAWLEIPDAHLTCSDNFVNLEPGKPARMLVKADRAMALPHVIDKLKVRSLFDM